MEKRRQEGRYWRYEGAGYRIKKYPYLPPQSLKYLNSTPRVFPTPGDLFTGAGLLEPRRRVGQVNNSKVKKKEVNIVNSDVDLELESGKE